MKKKLFSSLLAFVIVCTTVSVFAPAQNALAKKKPKVDMKTASTESLTKLYKKLNKDKKKYKIKVDYMPSDNSCLITIEDKGDYLTTTDFVRKQYTKYINFCKKAYKMQGLNNVQFDIATTMGDSKGNEEMEQVMSISMKKDVFDTYKWGKVKFNRQTIPAAIDAGEFEVNYIHPGVDKDVKWNKVYYEG